jgi:hypothetical protein
MLLIKNFKTKIISFSQIHLKSSFQTVYTGDLQIVNDPGEIPFL